MEFDRCVQIRLRTNARGTRKPKARFGSGYLVAPGLVLTSAHVLGDVSGPWPGSLTVCRPQPAAAPTTGDGVSAIAAPGDEQFSAKVRWYRKNDLVDAALVEVDEGNGWQAPESLQDTITRPPQRWGVLIGSRPHSVAVLGFPSMQKDVDSGLRLDEQLSGEIHPGSGSLAHRYEISSTSPVLDAVLAPGAAGTRWSGMSGAAVHSGDLLCGVTRQDRQAAGGTRLTATPAALLLADDGFRTIVTEHGSGWEPVLEPVEPASLFIPAAPERDLSSPAALLRADTEAVTFHGREAELAAFRLWCEDGSPDLSVHVLTGPGGQGKTRLARHLTDLLSREGWATGHLRSDLTDHDAPPDFTPLTTALPLLVVVDYAETRPRLLRRLINHLHSSRHRVRLLLLARSDGEWRTDALNAAPRTRNLLKAALITELPALIPLSRPQPDRPDQDRTSAFTRAAEAFARLLPHVFTLLPYDWHALAVSLRPPDDLGDARYDNILTLQMTALVTLLQHGPEPVHASPNDPAEEILLGHEERFWEDSANAPAFRLDLPTPVLARAVAVEALCGATDEDEALRVTRRVPDLPDDKAPRTVAWLATLYPSGSHRHWGSMQPDRIAEYHASRILTAGGIALPSVMAAASAGQQGQLIIVLSRAALAHYNARRTAESANVLRALDTALETTIPHHQALETAVAALPDQSHVTAALALRLAIALAQTVCDRAAGGGPAAGDPDANETEVARSLDHLGARLTQVRREAEAVTVTERAVGFYRRLVAENPAAHESDLARSLSNLGISLSDAGQRRQALTVTEEAVGIYLRLVAENPVAHESDLARSLVNLGAQMWQAGQEMQTLRVTEEALGIYRRLAAADPSAHESSLADSLSNLGICLSHVEGRRLEALTAAEEAVAIYRRLATENPAVYEPNLADMLSNLGRRLARVERESEALTATEEAVAIYRRLATENPAVYEPNLADLLSNLGSGLSLVERNSEALTAMEEAVAIYRRLVTENPAAYEPDLARSLPNLAFFLPRERGSEALTATEEAVAIYRRLAAENPAAYEPNLARSLSAFAFVRLTLQQELFGALQATGHAVEIYRKLVVAMPARFAPSLHFALESQKKLLINLGRIEEAEEVRRWLAANATVLN
ncbi:tetratricopeptide repeat protein [Streptomyces sp. NPDC002285]